MSYKGVDYQYAFEFNYPVEFGPSPRKFQIVIGDLRPKISGFTGLCLYNKLSVFSGEKLPFLAFFEIVSKTVIFTIQSDKVYFEENGKLPTPFLQVNDPEFLRQFQEKKKNAKSLEEYRRLKMYFEKLGTPLKDIPNDEKRVLCDAPNMWFFNDLIVKNNLRFENFLYFRG
jgi:hypothetical protein